MEKFIIILCMLCFVNANGQDTGIDIEKSGQSDVDAPKISFLTEMPTVIANEKLTFEVQIEDTKNKVSRLYLYCDDIPMYGIQGKDISSYHLKKKKPFAVPVDVELISGKNHISLIVENEKGIQSMRLCFTIECTKPMPKPNLYIVSIGTASFYNPDYNLTYAARDAQKFAETFEETNRIKKGNGENVIFDEVKTLVFTNNKALRSNIGNARLFLSNAKPNDMVIVFVASHGLLDEKKKYFLATYDMDFNNPTAKGLPYTDLEDIFDITPARKKLFLIDACFSGESDNNTGQQTAINNTNNGVVKSRGFKTITTSKTVQKNSLEVVKSALADMRKSRGVYVISSAGGNEFAFESKDWKNGVFTYCLLNGMITMSADKNKDNEISILELNNYVSEQVKILTNGKQNPTSRYDNITNDFVIWK